MTGRSLARRIRYSGAVLTARAVGLELSSYARLVVRRARPARTLFIILTAGKTGSTLLVDLLNSHPAIRCDQEVLSHPVLMPQRLLAARTALAGREAYGFKLRLPHLETQGFPHPAAALQGWHADGWKIVHLVRGSLLRRTVSSIVASRRPSPHHTRRDGPVKLKPLRLDVDELLARMGRQHAISRAEQAALANLPRLTVSYEEDLVDAARHQPALERVFAFLGLAPAPVRTQYVRIVAEPLDRLITNFDEVQAAVRASPFAASADL
jgi:hypothetical protein